jgi:hypothetical protein
MERITTIKRSEDWIAVKDGNKGQWESGKTEQSAVQALKVSFPELSESSESQ